MIFFDRESIGIDEFSCGINFFAANVVQHLTNRWRDRGNFNQLMSKDKIVASKYYYYF